MRVAVCFVALLVAAVAVMGASDMAARFAQFKAQYSKRYANAAEEASRFAIFVQNMQKAAAFQAANPKATFGVNEYADMSATERVW